jgi:hypothetical protein
MGRSAPASQISPIDARRATARPLVGWWRLSVRRDASHLLPPRALRRFRTGRRVRGRVPENTLRERDLVFEWPCFDSFQDRLAIAGWDRHDASHLRVAVLFCNCSTSYRRDIRLLSVAGSANEEFRTLVDRLSAAAALAYVAPNWRACRQPQGLRVHCRLGMAS